MTTNSAAFAFSNARHWSPFPRIVQLQRTSPREFLANLGSVAVVGYTKCRARATGEEYETEFVLPVALQDGKVQRFREFFDTYAAAEAFRPNAT